MKIIAKPPRCGKTFDLIKAADGRKGIIVVPNSNQKWDVIKLAHAIGADIIEPLTFDEFMDKHRRMGYPLGMPVYFDNVDLMLRQLGGSRFTVAAATIDAELVELSEAQVAPEPNQLRYAP